MKSTKQVGSPAYLFVVEFWIRGANSALETGGECCASLRGRLVAIACSGER
jgi:hypothetical protein